ncbi:MAG: thioredoxin family protein [Candidatus Binatia bacterium]
MPTDANKESRLPVAAVYLLAIVMGLALYGTAFSAGDWNDGPISWKGYEEGLAQAAADGKPVCLIFYTDWCPHCTRYSGVFHDPSIVELSKGFVMIRLNKDQNRDISSKYAPDGEYIPRTYFLSPQGELRATIHEERSNYLYFFREDDPTALARAMKEALGSSSPAPSS